MTPETIAPQAEAAGATPKDADTLAEYSAAHRALEVSGIAAFFLLCLWLAWRIWAGVEAPGQWWSIGAAVLAGYIGADFTSGLVHWGFDTWGSIYTPVLGKAFIRPFREHHFDEKAITRHDFVETNGNNSIVTLPILGLTFLVPFNPGETWGLALVAFVIALCVATFATNQIHAWSHADAPPALIRKLQKWHVILPPDHHAIHHARPHMSHYCITTGWLNPILKATGFFRGMERAITAVTGAQPREDDLA